MTHTFHQNIAHIIFSTKDRRPFINHEVGARLHAYLGGAIRGQGGLPIRVGGVADHVHIAAATPKSVSNSDLLREFKSSSTRWVRSNYAALDRFAWQVGYGWFSVSRSQLLRLETYIAEQPRHHRKMTFKEEFRELLDAHGIAYEETFFWD